MVFKLTSYDHSYMIIVICKKWVLKLHNAIIHNEMLSKTNNAKTVCIGGAQRMHVKDFTFISIHMVKEFSIAKIEKRNYRPHH